MNIKVKPEEYIDRFLQRNTLHELRRISEDSVKKLDERRVYKNKMDFVCDDLPDMANVIENSSLSPSLQKKMEALYGHRAKRVTKVYTKIQRRAYAFWTRVLKLVKTKA